MRTQSIFVLMLLAAVACSDKQNGDDDSSGGASGESGSGTGGKSTGGKGGSSSGTSGSDATGGSTSGASGSSGNGVGGSAGGVGGAGGSSAASGSDQGGTSGDSGQAGDAQAGDTTTGSGGADGGTSGTGGSSGGTGGSGGSGSGGTPLVVLLVDGSSSMFENGMWDAVYGSLVTDGVLDAFAGKLDLGLSVYQGSTTPSTETSASCAIMTNVDFGTDTGGEIATALSGLGTAYVVGTKYETPTGFGVSYAAMELAAVDVDVKKYIVLVTDGAPNTCAVLDPQCGEDVSIKAVQDARVAGIRTVPVGLDPILDPNAGCPPSARCGFDHLQDLANAGAGLPIEPPNVASFIHETCNNGVSLLATYAAEGGGGDATYYVSTNDGGLTGELTKAFQAIVADTVP